MSVLENVSKITVPSIQFTNTDAAFNTVISNSNGFNQEQKEILNKVEDIIFKNRNHLANIHLNKSEIISRDPADEIVKLFQEHPPVYLYMILQKCKQKADYPTEENTTITTPIGPLLFNKYVQTITSSTLLKATFSENSTRKSWYKSRNDLKTALLDTLPEDTPTEDRDCIEINLNELMNNANRDTDTTKENNYLFSLEHEYSRSDWDCFSTLYSSSATAKKATVKTGICNQNSHYEWVGDMTIGSLRAELSVAARAEPIIKVFATQLLHNLI